MTGVGPPWFVYWLLAFNLVHSLIPGPAWNCCRRDKRDARRREAAARFARGECWEAKAANFVGDNRARSLLEAGWVTVVGTVVCAFGLGWYIDATDEAHWLSSNGRAADGVYASSGHNTFALTTCAIALFLTDHLHREGTRTLGPEEPPGTVSQRTKRGLADMLVVWVVLVIGKMIGTICTYYT